MTWIIETIDVRIFALVCVGFIAAIAAYAAITVARWRRARRNEAKLAKVILDYFQKAGVTVTIGAVTLYGEKKFTVFIESEPMKQFRLSHIIEVALRDHVQKTSKIESTPKRPLDETLSDVRCIGVKQITRGRI